MMYEFSPLFLMDQSYMIEHNCPFRMDILIYHAEGQEQVEIKVRWILLFGFLKKHFNILNPW